MMDDRDHDGSGRRLVAPAQDDRARIEHALAHAESNMARMQPSPVTQHVKDVIESFRRMMAGWSTSPPTDDELHVLREHLERMLLLARTTSATVRPPRPA
jgi:hypothetical protein